MTVGEKLFKGMLTETNSVLVANGYPAGMSYAVLGRVSLNKDHKAQLSVQYAGVQVLTVDYPIRGYTKEVDIVTEVAKAEEHLFRKGLEVCGAVGLVSLAIGAVTGAAAMKRVIPVSYPDGDFITPFSDN